MDNKNSQQNNKTMENRFYDSCEILDYIENDIRNYFTDFSLEKHKKCRPPDEAYLFFPNEKELYESNEINKSKVFRKIFCLKNYTEYETEILIKFEAFIVNFNELNENRKINFSEDWEHWDTLRFLEAANYEFKKALQNISDYLDWRLVYFPLELSDKAIEILAFSGFIYCHGRDNNYRPNIFIKAEIYFSNLHKYSSDDWQMALVFFCEYVIKVMLIPGHIEQWNLFVDLENLGLTTVSEDMEKLINFFKAFYISRVNSIFVFSIYKKLESLYKFLLTMLEPATKNKIIFISESNKEEIFSKCNKEQIEQKYGGTAANIYESVFDLEKNLDLLINNMSSSSIDISNSSESNIIYFFPPIIPNNNFSFFFRKKFAKSLEKQNSLGKMNIRSKLSPNLICASNVNFLTPKVDGRKNNVFVYNPNNYKCIQMSELARKNTDRNFIMSNSNQVLDTSSNKSFFAQLPNNNHKKVSEAKELMNKLVPKPLNLQEISEVKNSKLEQLLSSNSLKNNKSFNSNKSLKDEKDLIEKIVEKGKLNN